MNFPELKVFCFNALLFVVTLATKAFAHAIFPIEFHRITGLRFTAYC